jgi:transcriptional regulator GlxA family with amidase domain
MKLINIIIIFNFFIISNFSLTAQSKNNKKKVAILIYEGVYLLDFCGPMEVFCDVQFVDTTIAFDVYTVASSENTINTHTNTRITPNFSIVNCPSPDILVIPGGNLNLIKEDSKIGDWIKSISKKAEITMSVCTGAFILADLGLLDNLKATTWYGATERLQKKYPKIQVQPGLRFVDNNQIITTAGITAGIDGALHIISKLYGKDIAGKTAKFIEYNYSE